MTQKREIFFGADHGGFRLKVHLMKLALAWGYVVHDTGTYGEASVDYPDFIPDVVSGVKAGGLGVLICGSGIGMSMGANRYPGIRAALCHNTLAARLAREHNDANVLVLGERLIGKLEAEESLKIFLNTEFQGGRHQPRVEKLR